MNLSSIKPLPWNTFKLPFNLQAREKIILTAGGMVLIILLLLELAVFPIMDRRTRLIAALQAQTLALADIQVMKSEFDNLTRENQRSESLLKLRQPGFTLFSFLEGLADRSGIKKNIESMKPSTVNMKNSPYSLSVVEMKIDGLSMEQLMPFLHGIETSQQVVWIRGISISQAEKNKNQINTVLHVETIQR